MAGKQADKAILSFTICLTSTCPLNLSGEFAKAIGAKTLAITHFSNRYPQIKTNPFTSTLQNH